MIGQVGEALLGNKPEISEATHSKKWFVSCARSDGLAEALLQADTQVSRLLSPEAPFQHPLITVALQEEESRGGGRLALSCLSLEVPMLLQLRILSHAPNWLQGRLPSTGSLFWGLGAFVSAQQSCVVAGWGAHANPAQMCGGWMGCTRQPGPAPSRTLPATLDARLSLCLGLLICKVGIIIISIFRVVWKTP